MAAAPVWPLRVVRAARARFLRARHPVAQVEVSDPEFGLAVPERRRREGRPDVPVAEVRLFVEAADSVESFGRWLAALDRVRESVVDARPQTHERIVRARGMDAIREQHDVHIPLAIDPE